MKKLTPMALSMAIPAAILLTACGSGGGSDSADNTPSDKRSSNDIAFTEDTSLAANITGIWIATIEGKVTEQTSSYRRTFDGTRRQTFYIIEDLSQPTGFDFGDVLIADCDGEAMQTVYDSSNLVFTREGISYSLQRQSNTRFTGTASYVNGNIAFDTGGTVTLIKVRQGPELRDFIDKAIGGSSQELGSVSYSYNGEPERTMGVDCYADASGTETYAAEGESTSNQVLSVTLSGLANDSIDITTNSGDDDTDFLTINAGGVSEYFASDNEPAHINFQATGTGDTATVSFDASMTKADASTSRSTITLKGNASLEF